MVLNTTFNNISAISWRSILLVEETRENNRSCRKSLTNLITYCCIEYTSPWTWFELSTSMVIDTDCAGSCKNSNYHMMTTPCLVGYLCLSGHGLRVVHVVKLHVFLSLVSCSDVYYDFCVKSMFCSSFFPFVL